MGRSPVQIIPAMYSAKLSDIGGGSRVLNGFYTSPYLARILQRIGTLANTSGRCIESYTHLRLVIFVHGLVVRIHFLLRRFEAHSVTTGTTKVASQITDELIYTPGIYPSSPSSNSASSRSNCAILVSAAVVRGPSDMLGVVWVEASNSMENSSSLLSLGEGTSGAVNAFEYLPRFSFSSFISFHDV